MTKTNNLRTLAVLALLCALLALGARPAHAAPGTLDPSFGGDGKVIKSFRTFYDEAVDLASQPDGKVVVAGGSDFIARYNANGGPDTGFGTGGSVDTAVGGASMHAKAVAVRPGGKLLVGGMVFSNGSWNFAVARFDSDGSPDTGFGTNGGAAVPISSGYDETTSMAVAPDGKIVLAGFTEPAAGATNIALARYNADGTPDTSFDTDGMLITTLPSGNSSANDVIVQPDGKIVVAGVGVGTAFRDMTLIRYNANGSLDTGFDADGVVQTDFAGSTDAANALTLQEDGKIVAAGVANTAPGNGDEDFALARYNPDGSLDAGFDGDGKVKTDVGSTAEFSSYDAASDLAIQPDGKIVAAGKAQTRTPGTFDRLDDFALGRYDANGALDTSFSGDGKLMTDFGSAGDMANALVLQSDGKILAGGRTDDSEASNLAVARYYGDDAIAPTITNLRPAPGSKIRDRTPIIAATVRDNQANLARSNIRLYVDGQRKTNFSYDPSTDRLVYTSGKLSAGGHKVKIVARDAQSKAATRSWGFRIAS